MSFLEEAQARSAEAITSASGSNLALALRVLPQARRADMRLFYAFCRLVDDLADEPGLPLELRRAGLQGWKQALGEGAFPGEPPLAEAMRGLMQRHQVPLEWALEIIRGCEMDLEGTRYATWAELRQYCYRVASAVGLVSARVFGGVGCERFAEDLGMALQLTNILRDMSEDYVVSGRVYIPREELERFEIEEGSWVSRRPHRWDEFVEFQLERARGFYAAARAALPASERRVMAAAEIMREIYGALLEEMSSDGMRVWERVYRLSRLKKFWLASKTFGRVLTGLGAGGII